jgi:hypothetical protein
VPKDKNPAFLNACGRVVMPCWLFVLPTKPDSAPGLGRASDTPNFFNFFNFNPGATATDDDDAADEEEEEEGGGGWDMEEELGVVEKREQVPFPLTCQSGEFLW